MTENQYNNTNKSFSIIDYLKELFDLTDDTNHEATIQSIESGISIKGSNAWVLIFSIVLASIGLNVSSTAVVIGAMLISPLMGPILGLGMSIAINDLYTLKKSLINLSTMVVISILTSFLFFSIPLFQDETPELLARTKPDLRDVLIALAGGLALIVSISRRSEMTNTIAGVAIATALMPPLCTAGFGLAIGNFSYFGGAFFLFIINSTFIALATFVILKSLKFQSVIYPNSTSKTHVARVASTIALLVLLGSTYTFYNLIKEKQYVQKVHKFNNLVKAGGFNLINTEDNFNYKDKTVTLTIFGKSVMENDVEKWKEDMKKLGLTDSKLIIQQNQDDASILKEISEIKENYAEQLELIGVKDRLIASLQKQVNFENIPLKQIGDEAKINYNDLKTISFAKRLVYDFKKIDTITVVMTQWNETLNADAQFKLLEQWVKTRLNTDKIQVLKE